MFLIKMSGDDVADLLRGYASDLLYLHASIRHVEK
jgi:hypothetical protein